VSFPGVSRDGELTAAWEAVLAHVVDAAHLAIGEQLSVVLDDAVRPLGLTADVLVADTAQRVLTDLRPEPGAQVEVEATVAGRAYQLGEILPGTGADGDRVLWVPVLDGTDRLGVMRVGFDGRTATLDGLGEDPALHRRLWTLAGLMGHIVATKTVYSDRLRRWRSNGTLSAASELLWQLLPPRTFATERVVVSAVLEPHREVAGDAFDYNVEGDVVDLAVYDAAGHDLHASLTTALAITGVRNARRRGESDLVAIAGRADELIVAQRGTPQFATAVLARLDTTTGVLEYLNAGHMPPLLIRGGKVVKPLTGPHRLPLGVMAAINRTPAVVAREQLEPGDRLLMYSDGITEARDEHGAFFGEERLIELTEHAAAADLSAPETLRRLALSVLAHQRGQLQDDATLLLAEWSPSGYLRMFPTLEPDEHP
jgi:serine phosphatase RsbU (regulator of sigma subunit)